MIEKAKKWLVKPSAMSRAAILLMVTMMLSNILGLVRNIVLSKNISLDRLDAYYTAFNIPDLVFNLFILGAISTALIPVFSELLSRDDEKNAWRVVNNFFNSSILFVVICLVIAFIFMNPLINILAPGFDTQKHILTVKLARIMLLSPLLFSMSYIIGGVLNTFKNFASYAVAPLIYNLAIIIGALIAPKYHGVETVALAVVIGAFAHLFIQLPAAFSVGWRYQAIIDLKDKHLQKIYKLMIPRSIGLGINQLNFIVFTIIGSTMDKGAIAIYKLTNDLQTTPTVVFGSSIALAVFPFMTEKAARNDKVAVRNLAIKSTRMILFFLIPSTVLGVILSPKVIPLYLALGHNMVNRTDTVRAIYTFSFLILSVVSQGLIGIYARVYYAYQDTKLPMLFSFISMIFSVLMALIFKAAKLDVAGLALAFTLGSWLNFILLLIWSKKYLNHETKAQKNTSLIKILFGTLISGLVTYLSLYGLEKTISSARVIGLFSQCLIAFGFGVIIYWYILRFLKVEELQWIKNKKKTFIEN